MVIIRILEWVQVSDATYQALKSFALLLRRAFPSQYFMTTWFINSIGSLESILFIFSLKGSSSIINCGLYCMGIMRQSACLVLNSITVYNWFDIGLNDDTSWLKSLIGGSVTYVCL